MKNITVDGYYYNVATLVEALKVTEKLFGNNNVATVELAETKGGYLVRITTK